MFALIPSLNHSAYVCFLNIVGNAAVVCRTRCVGIFMAALFGIFSPLTTFKICITVPGICATPYEDNLRYFNVAIAGPSVGCSGKLVFVFFLMCSPFNLRILHTSRVSFVSNSSFQLTTQWHPPRSVFCCRPPRFITSNHVEPYNASSVPSSFLAPRFDF